MKNWNQLVAESRRADVKHFRAVMRSEALRGRGEISPEMVLGRFSSRVDDAVRRFQNAIFYRDLAHKQAASVVEWESEVES